MGIDEAVDLIWTLPNGSAYVCATCPERSWTIEQEAAADVIDAMAWIFCRIDKFVRRPADIVAQQRAVERSRRARAVIEGTEWEKFERGER